MSEATSVKEVASPVFSFESNLQFISGSDRVMHTGLETPLEYVLSKFKLPFTPYSYQTAVFNQTAGYDNVALYAEVGTGKTVMSTLQALYMYMTRGTKTIILLPPVLAITWKRWLDSLSTVDGKPISSGIYVGTPAARAKLRSEDLMSWDFVIMSLGVFKNDVEYLTNLYEDTPLYTILDEAAAIKNFRTGNFKLFQEFTKGSPKTLLTGTPLTTPLDAYAYIKLLEPGIYRTYKQFENIHVGERDFFNNIVSWRGLDNLRERFNMSSITLLKQDVLSDLPEMTYVPRFYDLDPAHYRLYRSLMDEQLLPLKDGGKIDATTPQRMFNCAQQIVMNYGYFSQSPDLNSRGLELTLELLEELGDKKLLIFANYKMTIRLLEEKLYEFNPVTVFSETPDRQDSIDKFNEDPSCRVMIAQPKSGGVGLNLQESCHHVLFVELPYTPPDFHQAVGRVYRSGQKFPCFIHIAVASKTVQVRRHNDLLKKDELVNQVQRSYANLRDMIYGV